MQHINIIIREEDRHMNSSDKSIILCGGIKSTSKNLNRLTEIAARYIMENHNGKLIGKIVIDQYSSIGIDDMQEAIDYCTEYVNDSCKPLLRGYLKGPIMESQPCNIDGLIQFRLQQYRLFIQSIVEGIVYSYMEEKRSSEIVRTIQYVISIMEIRNEYIHITLKESRISVYDNNMKRVHHEPFDPMISALVTQGVETITDVDIAINTILSASPKYIVLHSEHRNPEISRLIRDIYGDRVSTCTQYCKLCEENNIGLDISTP
jgi:hypothetical protein